MVVNVGVVPPVLGSDVGRVRVLLGDVEWSPLPVVEEPVDPPVEDPVEPVEPPFTGFGLGESEDDVEDVVYGVYSMFSDDEIDVFLELEGSVEGAVASAFMQLATAAALEAKQVKDYDLQVDTSRRASELRQLAVLWRARADSVDGDIFEVFDTVVSSSRVVPELAPRMVGWLS